MLDCFHHRKKKLRKKACKIIKRGLSDFNLKLHHYSLFICFKSTHKIRNILNDSAIKSPFIHSQFYALEFVYCEQQQYCCCLSLWIYRKFEVSFFEACISKEWTRNVFYMGREKKDDLPFFEVAVLWDYCGTFFGISLPQ